MSLPVRLDWNVDEQAWAEAIARCTGATFFHTAEWLKTLERGFGSRVQRVRATLPEGRSALLPLTIRPLARGLLPVAFSGETGVYGGLLSPETLGRREVEAVYAAMRARFSSLQVVGNPFATRPHLPEPFNGGRPLLESSHALVLKPFEELRADMSRGCKGRTNKARRAGFALSVSQDPADARIFYELYLDSARRWGEKLTWIRPLRFFEALMAEGGSRVRLFLAREGDTPVAALLMCEYGAIAHYLAGATDARVLEASPSNLLMEAALRHYADAGFEIFDFGASNGLEGVRKFKESFGAHPVPYGSVHFRSPATQLYFALRAPWDRVRARARQFA
ncbi:MAG TPA: GNAT family N-acetyltransferase [Oscillatoriaceae cyanobacterium]